MDWSGKEGDTVSHLFLLELKFYIRYLEQCVLAEAVMAGTPYL